MTEPLQAAGQIHAGSVLGLRPFAVRRESGKLPLLSCPETRNVVEVTEQAIHVAVALRNGRTPQLISEQSRGTLASADVVAFAEQLHERGFIARIDGREIGSTPHGFFTRLIDSIEPARLAFLTSWPFLGCVAAAPLAALLLVLAGDAIWPSRDALWVLARPGLNMIVVVLGLLGMSLLHELAHMAVARRYGISSGMSVSHRFYVIVLQTDVTGAWLLPRTPRIAIFLAGMIFNVWFASTLVILATLPGLALGLQAALAFIVVLNVLPLIFQFFVFAQTDLYHVVLALSGERNLRRDSMAYFAMRTRAVWRRIRNQCANCGATRAPTSCLGCGAETKLQDEGLRLGARRASMMIGWAIFQVFGTAFGFAMMVFILLPFVLQNVVLALTLGMQFWHDGGALDGVEATLVLAAVGLQGYFLFRALGRGLFAVVRIPFQLSRRTTESGKVNQ